MIAKLTINVPADLRRRAHAVAALRGETVSEVIREALEKYVTATVAGDARQIGSDESAWEDDAIFRIVGIGTGGPADLSSDKYAYFGEAFD